MSGEKRRSENFSEAEKALLLNLLPAHLGVIEAPENDIFTNRSKKLTWESITRQYNKVVKEIQGPAREPHHLRGLYSRLKLLAKREFIRHMERNADGNLEDSLSKWSRLLYELVPRSVESLHKENQLNKLKTNHGSTDVSSTDLQSNDSVSAAVNQKQTFPTFIRADQSARKRKIKEETNEIPVDKPCDDAINSNKSLAMEALNDQSLNIQPLSLFEMLQIQLMTDILKEIRELKVAMMQRNSVNVTDALS